MKKNQNEKWIDNRKNKLCLTNAEFQNVKVWKWKGKDKISEYGMNPNGKGKCETFKNLF